MHILGIHDGHNASACLITDGETIIALQEERFTNTKNISGFPAKAVTEILKRSGLSPDDIDLVAVASTHTPTPFTRDNILQGYRRDTNLTARLKELVKKTPVYTMYKAKRRKEREKTLMDAGFDLLRVKYVDHHLCHAACAYYGAPWRDERVLVLTNDGSGDGLCATVSVAEGGVIKRIAETEKGHSIGNIYSRTTFMMGLVPLEHEFKIMGMAPYASPAGAEKGYEAYADLIDVNPDDPLTIKRAIPEPTHLIYQRLRERTEFLRFDWISAGLQRITEEVISRWVEAAVKKTGISTVVMAGGVFMNVAANKRVLELPCVDKLFVFPSCGDDTTAIGAAYQVYADVCRDEGREIDIPPIEGFYLGDDFTDADVSITVDAARERFTFDAERVKDIDGETGALMAAGEVVARCQGRMEFGARALGNRSILGDASDANCVRTINMMIKKRDFWMPFAPVMLDRRASDYIINPKEMPAPYMIMLFDTTKNHEDLIAAVHQADLTARPQVIRKDWNGGYYRVLESFEKETGRGVALNTSFNLHGYPIVHGPEEALWVFENSVLTHLALGDMLLSKKA